MQITITVSDRDADRIIKLGSIPWHKITDKDKEELSHLVSLCGTAVCMKVFNREV